MGILEKEEIQGVFECLTNLRYMFGSEREFVETRILGCFLKNDEFGLGDCHALGLEQQVAEILVAAAPSK